MTLIRNPPETESRATQRPLCWHDFLTINAYWLGLNISSGAITPVLLPFLVAAFVPTAEKTTYLAGARVLGLAAAMLVQPLSGLLSDRNTSSWGRRRPFIATGAALNILVLGVIGAAPAFAGRAAFGLSAAYLVLVLGIVLQQASANLAQGALQALLPDAVPEGQRGLASGVKSVFELLPIFLVILIGPLVQAGRIWLVLGIVAGGLAVTAAINVRFVREEPLPVARKPAGGLREPVLRVLALTAIFVAATQGAVWLVRTGGHLLGAEASVALRVTAIGLAGLAAMAAAIFAGVFAGAWVGIGRGARAQTPFIWWVVNRLLFLAAVGSIQGFAQYYLGDVLHIANPVSMTTVLLAAVAVFLLPSALAGGYLADRMGRRRLVALAGLIAAAGTLALLLAHDLSGAIVGACLIGLGAGTFMATNWALGTDLAPREAAGKYLGISNLAGAGAGIVGAGIGGPLADSFNALQPGLGYRVVFAIYGGLFLLSVAVLRQVKQGDQVSKEDQHRG